MNQLTDREFWLNYWESKTGLAVEIPSNYLFHAELYEIITRDKINTAIELGGFPGYYAVFLKKYFQLEVSLLDYFVHKPITDELLKNNNLKPDAIQIIEADLFKYKSEVSYDLVLSCGLIEHFEDTRDILQRHLNFLKPGGVLFITLPNFHALNGWFQKKFDYANYEKHNLASMDPQRLKEICESLGLMVKKAQYFGNFSIWLENEKLKPLWVQYFKKAVWLIGKIFTKLIPFESKQLSPYIIIEAQKN
ncbi:MAG: class I SAM-dependent methyltransferase [Pedobacter sp.]|nr:MAG: class I SAM-dependent methyltransferase [Pedobacter sp.]